MCVPRRTIGGPGVQVADPVWQLRYARWSATRDVPGALIYTMGPARTCRSNWDLIRITYRDRGQPGGRRLHAREGAINASSLSMAGSETAPQPGTCITFSLSPSRTGAVLAQFYSDPISQAGPPRTWRCQAEPSASSAGSTRLGWRHGFILDPSRIQGASHRAGGFHLLHELAHKSQRGRPMLRNRNRLPPRGKASIKHACARMPAGKGAQPPTLRGDGIDLPPKHHLVGCFQRGRGNQPGVPQ